MRIDLLQRFTTTPTHCYDLCLVQEQHALLGLLYTSEFQADLFRPASDRVISFALFDIQNQQCAGIVTYREEKLRHEYLSDAFLRYDVLQFRWVMAQLHEPDYVAVRTVSVGSDGSLTLSPLAVLDRNESYLWGIDLLLDLEIRGDRYRLLYQKPDENEYGNRIVKQDVVLHQPWWSTLEERAAAIRSGDAAEQQLNTWEEWSAAVQQSKARQGQRLLDTLLLPKQILYDRRILQATQTRAIELSGQAEITYNTELAMTITAGPLRLIVECTPTVEPGTKSGPDTNIEQMDQRWRIKLTGWKRNELTLQWSYSPDMSLSIDPTIPTYERQPWPTVEVAAIAGPFTHDQRATFVATMAMQGKGKDGHVPSRGICLDHEGALVRVCREPLGRFFSLCCCGAVIVGIDYFQTSWRLWNWALLDEEQFHNCISLDATCQRAFVRAQPETNHCWLIEELPDSVRVSRRDAQTLSEITPGSLITGMRLLPAHQEQRALDSNSNVGLIPYGEKLLLLLQDEQGALVLYQAQ